jgi:Ca2+-transporting ATPase
MMTTIQRQETGNILVFIKGAPERVLPICIHEWRNGELTPLDGNAHLLIAENMAKEGLRVLAIAHRRLDFIPSEMTSEKIETDLIFLGFVGLIDPPRPEAKKAIEIC